MGGFSINSTPEKMQEQLNLINGIAEQNAKKEYALQDQAQTNADAKTVKDYLYYGKDQTVGKDKPYSRFRNESGRMARDRLENRGVDTDSLITGSLSANEGYKKGGAINLKNCKVNSVEKNSKHKNCW